MEETRRTVSKLVAQFMDGDIQLPEIQRNYIWTKEKVRALVDSIYKGYPSGSILLWETDAKTPTHSPAAVNASRSARPSALLLDGQQRITSLAAVMNGTPVEMRVGKSVKPVTIKVYFNVDHPDAPVDADSQDDDHDAGGDSAGESPAHHTFRLASKKMDGNPLWVAGHGRVQQGHLQGPDRERDPGGRSKL